MPYAGRGEIFITLLAKGANAAAVTFNVTVQESADATFASVGTFSIQKPDELPVIKAIRLPADAKLRKVRLSVAVTGTVIGLTLFAGVTRDHFAPYDDGLYIDKGKVQK